VTAAVARTALEVADWRRRVFAIYAKVRASTDLFAAHDLWRRARDELLATHPSTPLLADDRERFSGLRVTTYDPDWRFDVPITPAEPRHMDVETGTDGLVPFDLIGIADVPGVGSLDVWALGGYGGGIFIPVKDALSRQKGGTYGGGRYLIDTIKGADLGSTPSSIVLDFNFAYNPSCAYDPEWACPLAQAGNTVEVEIPVGERYSGTH
jgi:uncharacterized protein (DUF1684 family)